LDPDIALGFHAALWAETGVELFVPATSTPVELSLGSTRHMRSRGWRPSRSQAPAAAPPRPTSLL